MYRLSLLLLVLVTAACAPVSSAPGDDDSTVEPWDAGPPEVAAGTTIVAILDCGMLDGTSDVYWTFDGDGWTAVERQDSVWFEPGELDDDSGRPHEEVKQCFTSGAPRDLDWTDAGELTFYNGNWSHDLGPTEVVGRWFGGVSPMQEMSAECLDGLELLGLEPPVALTLTVLGTTEGELTW